MGRLVHHIALSMQLLVVLLKLFLADVCVDVAVQCRGRQVKLPIFVNTGGQACLNKVSWQALAPNVDVSSWEERKYLFGTIHGIDAQVHFGQGRTAGVNMVGIQWLSRAGLILIAGFARLGCALVKSDEQSREALLMLPSINKCPCPAQVMLRQ